MVLVAFERFFSIIMPFERVVTKFRAKLVMVILFLVCVAIGTLGALGFGIYHPKFLLNSVAAAAASANSPNSFFSANSTEFPITINYLNESELYSSELADYILSKSTDYSQQQLAGASSGGQTTTTPKSKQALMNRISLDDPIKINDRLSIKLECAQYEILAYYSYDAKEPDKKVSFIREERKETREIVYHQKLGTHFTHACLVEYAEAIEIALKKQANTFDTLCHLGYYSELSGANQPSLNVTYYSVDLVKTEKCFPNELYISSDQFSYLRLVQNSLIFVCFTIIFVLYALIFAFVSKRRQLKTSRAKHYRNILLRSRKNTHGSPNTPAETTMTTMSNGGGGKHTVPKLLAAADAENPVASTGNQSNGGGGGMMTMINGKLINSNAVDLLSLGSSLNSNQPDTLSNKRDQDELKSLKSDSVDSKPLSMAHEPIIINSMEQMPNDSSNQTKSTQTNASSVFQMKTKGSSFSSARKLKQQQQQQQQPSANQVKRLDFAPLNESRREEGENLIELTERSLINQDPKSLEDMAYPNSIYKNNLLGNLKTAFMLFVVTLIMAIAYTPAILTSLHIIEYNPFHWNLYFLINAVNPIVYSFLNENFRKSLKASFKSCCERCSSTDA